MHATRTPSLPPSAHPNDPVTPTTQIPGEQVSALERMSWLIELMTRYARERTDSSDQHDSPRLAAAIVTHLRALSAASETSGDRNLVARFDDTIHHWFDAWDSILTRQLQPHTRMRDPRALDRLIERAKAF